jgi:enoyl-CoA hydratase
MQEEFSGRVSSAAPLLLDRPRQGVLVLRLDRRERRNALDEDLVEALVEAIREPRAQAIVLGSTSREAFCSGIDRTLPMPDRARVSDRLYELYGEMIACPSVIIAALDGHVIGGGVQLALAGDIRIAGPDTRFRFAGPSHGLAVGAWGLPSLVGRGRALELCLSSRAVSAEKAVRIGLADRMSVEPQAAAVELAVEIASCDPDAVRRCKAVVGRASAAGAALQLEREGNAGWDGSLEPRMRETEVVA